MKKRLTHILLCMLLLTIFFSVSVKAEEKNRATLTVDENRVGISLEIPAGKTDAIHSLRIRLSVTASEEITGTFAFDSNIQTTVQDAAWSKQNSVYIMDVILSGKQDLISESGVLSLGTLSLTSDSTNSWSAEIGISENCLFYFYSFDGSKVSVYPFSAGIYGEGSYLVIIGSSAAYCFVSIFYR